MSTIYNWLRQMLAARPAHPQSPALSTRDWADLPIHHPVERY